MRLILLIKMANKPVLLKDKARIDELCARKDIKLLEKDGSITLANDCSTLNIDSEYTCHQAFLKVIGKVSPNEERDIGEFANSEFGLYMKVAGSVFPGLQDLGDLYQKHSLDAGITNDFETGELHMVTWLSLPNQRYWKTSRLEMLTSEHVRQAIVNMSFFAEANTSVYRRAVEQCQKSKSPLRDYWAGKTLEPSLPRKVAEEFMGITQKTEPKRTLYNDLVDKIHSVYFQNPTKSAEDSNYKDVVWYWFSDILSEKREGTVSELEKRIEETDPNFNLVLAARKRLLSQIKKDEKGYNSLINELKQMYTAGGKKLF